ncbi:MAG: hypothetical protein ACYDCL_16005 [Myxococcales bacterium]
MRLGAALLVAAAVAAAGRAAALEPILDHRDQWGLTLELGTSYDVAVNQKSGGANAANYSYTPGFLPLSELGATWAVTDDGGEITLRVRFVAPVDAQSVAGLVLQEAHDTLHWLFPSVLGGWRGYFGYEELKTFFDADLYVNTFPYWGVGPNLGLGLQYDFGRAGGVFARLGFGVTFGDTILASFDGELGGQLRF